MLRRGEGVEGCRIYLITPPRLEPASFADLLAAAFAAPADDEALAAPWRPGLLPDFQTRWYSVGPEDAEPTAIENVNDYAKHRSR